MSGPTSLVWGDAALTIIALILISASVYAAGMMTNDIFDLAEDARDRPQRPIPSGRVSLSGAWRMALTLQLFALGVGAALSHCKGAELNGPLMWAIGATIVMTYLYNGALKQSVSAPIVMGLCRFGNFWIGGALIALTPEPQSLTTGLALASGTLCYVTALTALSRAEVTAITAEAEAQRGQHARLAAYALCLSALHPLVHLVRGTLGWGALASIITGMWLARACAPLLSGADTSASAARKGVGAGIRGVALGNAALCLGLGTLSGFDPSAALIAGLGVAALILMMVWAAGRVARWFYAT